MGEKYDILLINPGDRKQVYQELGEDYSAIEPPFWIAVIGAHLRNRGFRVSILDANAENIAPEEVAKIVGHISPSLAAVIVYGSQPSASTQNMTIAGRICREIKENTGTLVAIGGLHPSALPKRTLEEERVDFVIQGEAFLTLNSLLKALKSKGDYFSAIPGLWYKDGNSIIGNCPPPLAKNLDETLPIAAWDLLPMAKYKAHNWHCFDNLDNRSSYGAIYTSLGCPYSCIFCCINAPFGKPGIRYRSPDLVLREIDLLVENYSIKNLKIVDELFVLNENHYMKIVDSLIDRNYGLNIWAYARVDTVKKSNLSKMRRAGINWIALGIESAHPDVRDGAQKHMRIHDIENVVRSIQGEGIKIIGNYIFGLPDDSFSTMEQTLDMAMELNCEFANFYSAMAYPGSKLFDIAIQNGWELPSSWQGFSQYSYDIVPLPTKHLSAREVLTFRDNAFQKYFTNPSYLQILELKFGNRVRIHVEKMCSIRLKRKILDD